MGLHNQILVAMHELHEAGNDGYAVVEVRGRYFVVHVASQRIVADYATAADADAHQELLANH